MFVMMYVCCFQQRDQSSAEASGMESDKHCTSVVSIRFMLFCLYANAVGLYFLVFRFMFNNFIIHDGLSFRFNPSILIPASVLLSTEYSLLVVSVSSSIISSSVISNSVIEGLCTEIIFAVVPTQ